MSVDPAELLRQKGFKVTAQRLAVLRAVSGRPHSTADEIAKAVRAEIGAISHQAVYDAVGVLTDKGLLRRIQPAGSAARYEDRVGDNHHHLICRTCGRMVDVDCAVGDTPCLTAADDRGLRDRRSRGHLLGPMPRVRRGDRRRPQRHRRHSTDQQPEQQPSHEESTDSV